MEFPNRIVAIVEVVTVSLYVITHNRWTDGKHGKHSSLLCLIPFGSSVLTLCVKNKNPTRFLEINTDDI